MSIHAVKREHAHLAWDNSIPPVLTIASGETVSFDCLDASNGQITASSTSFTLSTLDFSKLDQVNGPIYISGAKAGDVLHVEVLELQAADWGWTGLIPGFGLLSEEFSEAELKIWKLEKDEEGPFAWFSEEKGIRVPLRPFCGEMGVAPGKEGAHSTIPPYRTGGNLDTKYLTKGAVLYLPVEVDGALFSIGDGHAVQGDGEVCGTAIETPIRVSVRLTVLNDHSHVETPHFKTVTAPLHSSSTLTGESYYATTGIGPSILDATKDAVRGMIKTLGVQHGLSRVEAYMLCSVAGDLRLHEVVDMPNYVVGMMMPQSIFRKSAT